MNRRIVENVLNTPESLPADQLTALGLGSIPAAVSAYITRKDSVNGVRRQTVLTIAALPIALAVTGGSAGYLGTEIFDFPKCRMDVTTVLASLAFTTTSTLSSTLNASTTLPFALGTVTASNTSLTSTMVDLCPSSNTTSSATINVAGATVNAALAAATAQFDGTGTAKKVFLNVAAASGLSGTANLVVSGTIVINWNNFGTYSLVNGQ